jgi:hypothetical protein
VVPYIQDTAYGNLHAKVSQAVVTKIHRFQVLRHSVLQISFVWAGFSTVTIAYVYFVIPETGNRTLEELDLVRQRPISVLDMPLTEI